MHCAPLDARLHVQGHPNAWAQLWFSLPLCRVLVSVPPSLTSLDLQFTYNGPRQGRDGFDGEEAYYRMSPPYASLRGCLRHLPELQVR